MRARGALQRLVLTMAALAVLGQCSNSAFFTALGNKAQLVIAPTTASVPASGSVAFSASGGTPPYRFSVISGPGSIDSSSGVYAATASPGPAVVQVKDSQGAAATAAVNPVTYAVTSVTMDGTSTNYTGGTVSGTFTFRNTGTSNGTQQVSWTVYASPTATLSGGQVVVASGTTDHLNGGTTSSAIPWGTPSNCYWPDTPGFYYLIASVSSPDSAGAAGAAGQTQIFPSVDYAVTAVSFSSVATTSLGGAANGTFRIVNNGPNSGVQNVTWRVYANTTPTPGGTTIASSTTMSALVSGASSDIPFSGTWSSSSGANYLVIQVSTADHDWNAANDVAVVFDAVLANSAANTFATASPLGVTLQPGTSIQVAGNLTAATSSLNNFFTFNAGSAASVTFSVTWASSAPVTLDVLAPPGPPGTNLATSSATGTSLSTVWTLTAGDANQLRYVQLYNTSATGIYVMTITAN